MNKLNVSFLHPVEFEWDDLDWLQEGIFEAFYGMLSAFGIDPEDSFKLSGCQVGGDQTHISTTAGFIALNGEILKVDEHSLVIDQSDKVAFRLNETNDQTGTELDSEGNTVETYKVRRGKLTVVSSYTNEMQTNAPYLIDVIKEKIHPESDWVQPALGSGHTHDPSNPVKYKLNMDGNLMIKGKFSSTTGCSSTVFQLNSGYRPPSLKSIQVFQGLTPLGVYIDNSGNIYIQGGESFVAETGNVFNNVVIF